MVAKMPNIEKPEEAEEVAKKLKPGVKKLSLKAVLPTNPATDKKKRARVLISFKIKGGEFKSGIGSWIKNCIYNLLIMALTKRFPCSTAILFSSSGLISLETTPFLAPMQPAKNTHAYLSICPSLYFSIIITYFAVPIFFPVRFAKWPLSPLFPAAPPFNPPFLNRHQIPVAMRRLYVILLALTCSIIH